LLRLGGAAESGARSRLDQTVFAVFNECRRRIVKCRRAKRISFAQIEGAKLRSAKARRVRQYRAENRVKRARRVADDFEHFGGCSLLLQRLHELALQVVNCIFGILVGALLLARRGRFFAQNRVARRAAPRCFFLYPSSQFHRPPPRP
jgi:hypothetical protein